jgi:hypothetical protein
MTDSVVVARCVFCRCLAGDGHHDGCPLWQSAHVLATQATIAVLEHAVAQLKALLHETPVKVRGIEVDEGGLHSLGLLRRETRSVDRAKNGSK